MAEEINVFSEEETTDYSAKLTELGKTEEEVSDIIKAAESKEGIEETITSLTPAEPAETIEQLEPLSGPEPGEPKNTKNVQARIDKITREKYDERRRGDALEKRLAVIEGKIGTNQRPVRPNIKSYVVEGEEMDYQAYDSAMTEYEDGLFTWKETQGETKRRTTDAETARESMMDTFSKQTDAIRAKHSDYDEVVNRPVFTPEMQDAIFESEHGAEIAYHLGKNGREATKIANLSPSQMNREFGKLEARFSAVPLTKKISNAPSPIKPVGGAETIQKDPAKMNASEYYEAKKAGLIK